jgi:hypothetical protein
MVGSKKTYSKSKQWIGILPSEGGIVALSEEEVVSLLLLVLEKWELSLPPQKKQQPTLNNEQLSPPEKDQLAGVAPLVVYHAAGKGQIQAALPYPS